MQAKFDITMFAELEADPPTFYLHNLNSTNLLLDLSVSSSRYQEATGATLAADGDNLGLLLSVEQWAGQTLDQILATQTDLVVNGDFLTDVSGWTFAGVGGISWDNGRLYLNSTATWQGPFQDVSTLVVGNQYSWSFDYEKDTCTDFYVSGTAEVSGYRPAASPSGHETKIFQASATAMRMHFRNGNASGNPTNNFWIAGVSIKKIPSLAFKQTNGPQIPKFYNNPPRVSFDGIDDTLVHSFDGGSGPPDCTFAFISRTFGVKDMFFYGQDVGKWLFLSQQGDTGSISANCGSPVITIDNAGVTTRGDIYSIMSDNGFHIGIADGCDFSGWSEINISGYAGGGSWSLDGDIGRLMIIPTGQELTDNRDNIIAAMIEGYGVTLA